MQDLEISPDGTSLLYALRCEDFRTRPGILVHESQTILFKDGVPVSKRCFSIEDIRFDEKGTHYAARTTHVINNQRTAGLIKDGLLIKRNWANTGTLSIHPTTGSVAHRVLSAHRSSKTAGKYFAGLNGELASGGFEFMRDPVVFVPHSESIAFAGKRQKRWAIYIGDKKISADFEDMTAPAFNPKNGALFFGAQKDGAWAVFGPEGKLSSSFDEVGRPHFSPDGAHVAYRARQGSDWCMAFDHKIFPRCFDKLGEPVYSGDGFHIAYRACLGPACFVMKNDTQETDEFLWVSDIALNRDGSAILYSAKAGTRSQNLATNLTYFVMKNRKRVSPVLRSKMMGRWHDETNITIAGFDKFEGQIVHGTTQ